MEKVNWKEKYNQLKASVEVLIAQQEASQIVIRRMQNYFEHNDALDLRERNKKRFLRLKEAVTIKVRYDDFYRENLGETRSFKQGTLVEARKGRSGFATVYLDDDGDGYLDFPADKLEEVELDWCDTIDLDNVVSQG